MPRFVFMMLDGVGVGSLPDAGEYGDEGANTLGNLARLVELQLPNLASLGLGNIIPLRGVPPAPHPLALPGRLVERSQGKDTTAGHWEHMGVVTQTPLRTYPHGFPEEVLAPFRRRIGRDVLGNKAASGTDIIAELGEEHMRSGRPIVYTSADSVFQVAAHVGVVPLEELYEWCAAARAILTGRHTVGRVIARPFTGEPGAFVRTKDRKDFSLEPPQGTYLDLLKAHGVPTVGLGKIFQIYAGRGISEELKVACNDDNLAKLVALLREGGQGLLMTNLVDFDMLWGHRNDLEGFAAGLAAVDRALPEILSLLSEQDRLLITADHGVDPTTDSTDHSREYVPLLYYPRPPGAPPAVYQGYMSDTGATAFSFLTGKRPGLGGFSLEEPRPDLGWRPYPSIQESPCGAVPCVVGPDEAREAAAFLGARFGAPPAIAVVLGSGLDAFTEGMTPEGEMPYEDIPHWAAGVVPGHSGRLLVGTRSGRRLVVLRGRVHGYEGFDRSQQQLPVRTLAGWGVRHLILTNAAGALSPDLEPGRVAIIAEILDLQAPLPSGRPARLRATDPAAEVVFPAGHSRVYVCLPGPQYETPAEVAVLRALGGDLVGMSTAAEVAAAREEGLSLAVLSLVTNPAGSSSESGVELHDEVLAWGSRAAPRLLAAADSLLAAWDTV